MYELKITADSVANLVLQLDQLRSALPPAYVVRDGAADVPLPEPRAELAAGPEKAKRKYTRKGADSAGGTTSGEIGQAASEPEEAMHAAADQAETEIRQQEPETSTDAGNVNKTAEIEHVEADVSEKAPEPDTSQEGPTVTKAHADVDEVYLLAGDGYNNDGRRLTYKNGVRFSTVHKSVQHKHEVYDQHAPEKPSPIGDDDIPEHMRDGPATVEEAQAEVMVPLTEKDEAAVAELEAEAAEDDMPSDFAAYIDTVENATAWDQVKVAMREFFGSDTFKGFTPDQQNRVRANTAEECFAHVQGLPDHADDITMFRIWIEAADDVDAIVGTKRTLEQSDQWKAVSDATRAAINQAVDVRLSAFR